MRRITTFILLLAASAGAQTHHAAARPPCFVNDAIGSLPPGIRFQFMQTTKTDDQTRTVDVTVVYRHR